MLSTASHAKHSQFTHAPQVMLSTAEHAGAGLVVSVLLSALASFFVPFVGLLRMRLAYHERHKQEREIRISRVGMDQSMRAQAWASASSSAPWLLFSSASRA